MNETWICRACYRVRIAQDNDTCALCRYCNASTWLLVRTSLYEFVTLLPANVNARAATRRILRILRRVKAVKQS